MMKEGVPALNAFLAFCYFLAAGALLFILKKIFVPKDQPANARSSAKTVQDISPSFKMLGIAWFKKYTLASAYFSADKKYILKECFIISAYAVACFNINNVILWPVTFSLFLLPITVLLFEVVIKKAKQSSEQSTNNVQVMNVIDERQIQVENIGIQIKKNSNDKINKGKSMLEIGIATGMTLAGLIMWCQCSMNLANSISNSGELNILSLLAMLPLDQLLIRPMTGFSLLLTLKILEMGNLINFQTNIFVLYFCEEELIQEKQEKMKVKVQVAHDVTSSPLRKQNGQQIKGKAQMQAEFLDLDHLKPYQSQQEKQEVQQQKQVQEAMQYNFENIEVIKQTMEDEQYLTTPEKQLFEQSQSQPSDKTYVETVQIEKQNTEPEVNFSRQSESIDIKRFDEFILANEPLRAFTNEIIVPRRKNARKNKRVLKMTGSSPYLQYLPNMLKKVENYKHLVPQKPSKML